MNAWDFVDALLEDAVKHHESCSFPPAQAIKLREMIAEIPRETISGRKRSRLAKDGTSYVAKTVRIPEQCFNTLDNIAQGRGIAFNTLLTEICRDYLERTDDELQHS